MNAAATSPAASPENMPPEAVIMNLLFGKMNYFSLAAIARLGIADHMSEAPTDVEQIALSSGTQAPFLYRVLRLLSSVGVFTEGPPRHFALSPAGRLMQSGNPHSMRDMAIMFADPWKLQSYARMDDCLRTGKDGVSLAFGKHAFDLFPQIPDQAANFHRAMTSFSRVAADAILEVADFSPFHRIADCGGGHGILLSRILEKFPQLKGVLFDLAEVVSGALGTGHFRGAEDRVTIEPGSFFERVPGNCDAYIMKHIVHDWDDGSCRRILSLMREQLVKTAPNTGRVFLAEMVVPDSPAPAPAKMLDIEMLVCTPGGKERTAAEFAQLLESAGLRLIGIKPLPSPVCLLEAAVY
jgi:hypothetical protein